MSLKAEEMAQTMASQATLMFILGNQIAVKTFLKVTINILCAITFSFSWLTNAVAALYKIISLINEGTMRFF